ncbi:unnamed protein product [Gordionus sp. m RMFG-2023]|uniref:vesicle-associated membrane protein-associated protein A-like n=1 Tax=Gordionus sp. m RMFG-2023 TaxID=3053472 RepID=UPI0030E107D9
MNNWISISPDRTLSFQGPFDQPRKKYVNIQNISPMPIKFKITSTDPEKYSIHPSEGEISTSNKVDVVVELLPFEYRWEDEESHRIQVTAFQTGNKNEIRDESHFDQILKVILKPGSGASSSRDKLSKKKGIKREQKDEHKEYIMDYPGSPILSSSISDHMLREKDPEVLKRNLVTADRELETVRLHRDMLKKVYRKADRARSDIDESRTTYIKRTVKDRLKTIYAIQVFTLTFLLVFISFCMSEFLMNYVVIRDFQRR